MAKYKHNCKKRISRVYLSRMEKEGIIEKVDRGMYVTQDFKYDEYYLFQLKYPKVIFSYNTALYFYEMAKRTPIKMDVTVCREYNPHRFKDLVNVYKASKELYGGNYMIKNAKSLMNKSGNLAASCNITANEVFRV